LKVSICDDCQESDNKIFFKNDKVDLCEECYYESKYYDKSDIEEEYGIEVAKKVKGLDGFITLHYESIQYYDEDSKKIADELNKVFKKMGVQITAVPKWTEDNAIIGFKKH